MESAEEREDKRTWRERIDEFFVALENAPRAFSLLWEADRSSTLVMAGLTALGGATPVGHAWVTKQIIDGVLAAVRGGLSPAEGMRAVVPYVVFEFGLIMLGSVSGQFRMLTDKLIDHRLGHLINVRIIRKALSLESRYFEDPEFYDKMQNARRQSEYRTMALVRAVFMLVQNLLTLLSFAAVLFAFNKWIALILFGATIPAFVVQCRYSAIQFRLETWRTPETRSMSYLEQVLTLDTTVKEVKLFGLGEPLLARYAKIFRGIFETDAKLARSSSLKAVLWGLVATATYYGAYVWILSLTLAGKITLGQMTLYITVFSQSQGTFNGMLDNLNRLYEDGLFLTNLFTFLGIPSAALNGKKRAELDPSRGIEFEDVWFQYPGRTDWALQGLTLKIHPGEKMALVGDNGAGKTTLIKLLAGLYSPSKGRVLFHGVDVRDFDPDELHSKLGAIFQDFVRYHLAIGENIGLGSVAHLDDQPRIERSAAKSGADAVVEELPKKYQTMLGRWFDSGHELSGGQWQKVALGRAFMREAEVLILDEPTASLDAKAEFEIFQRFQKLSEGKIVLLVSHRFSTVRMADRIVVISGGKVSELGSHQELIKLGGTYAKLFELQAQGYR
jgi:ATP-binding cassette subfamily B protein